MTATVEQVKPARGRSCILQSAKLEPRESERGGHNSWPIVSGTPRFGLNLQNQILIGVPFKNWRIPKRTGDGRRQGGLEIHSDEFRAFASWGEPCTLGEGAWGRGNA